MDLYQSQQTDPVPINMECCRQLQKAEALHAALTLGIP